MKRTAFTLPEILITLGAIGIVAAMTVPVLFSNINNVKFRSQENITQKRKCHSVQF